MSQHYTIKESTYDHDFVNQYQKTMRSYNIILVDGRGEEIQCYTNRQESSQEPIAGERVYGFLETDKMGNPKFTKQPEPEGVPATRPVSQGAGTVLKAPQHPAIADDERQTVIVRQNALTNANANAAARSQVFIAQKKFDDAERVLKPSSIAFIQHWFYKASMGEWRMDMGPEAALDLMGFEQDKIDEFVRNRYVELAEEAISEEEK